MRDPLVSKPSHRPRPEAFYRQADRTADIATIVIGYAVPPRYSIPARSETDGRDASGAGTRSPFRYTIATGALRDRTSNGKAVVGTAGPTAQPVVAGPTEMVTRGVIA